MLNILYTRAERGACQEIRKCFSGIIFPESGCDES
jgi:hypothetical protein